jgi:GNAT superfamily N-acetyltransferase
MVRPDLEAIPEATLPPRFRIRPYRDGDAEEWVRIHKAADRYNKATTASFEKQFGKPRPELAERMRYLVDPRGRVIGTATAWPAGDRYPPTCGRVHWVAVIPEFQGRGLSKPLMADVLERLRALGYTSACLSTSTGRVAAVCLYTRFGFRPELRTDEDREHWRLFEQAVPAWVKLSAAAG